MPRGGWVVACAIGWLPPYLALTSGTFGGKRKGPQGGLWDLGVTSI